MGFLSLYPKGLKQFDKSSIQYVDVDINILYREIIINITIFPI